MKTIGIICEYNPFHTGHHHQLDSVKRDGAAVICLMSGNSTQRGELAITDKFTRAECALASGADLVLELPFPYCSSSADYFAGAGVALLHALSVDEINFGSESADRERLLAAARASATEEFDCLCKEMLESKKHLGAAEAVAWAEEMGLHPRHVERSIDRHHIFTHIRWDLRGWVLEVAEAVGGYTWLPLEEIDEQAALPTAFRQFREEI